MIVIVIFLSWSFLIICSTCRSYLVVGFSKLELELELSLSSLFVLGVYFRVDIIIHLLFYVFVILLFICVSD
jgi:hypothetical protein